MAGAVLFDVESTARDGAKSPPPGARIVRSAVSPSAFSRHAPPPGPFVGVPVGASLPRRGLFSPGSAAALRHLLATVPAVSTSAPRSAAVRLRPPIFSLARAAAAPLPPLILSAPRSAVPSLRPIVFLAARPGAPRLPLLILFAPRSGASPLRPLFFSFVSLSARTPSLAAQAPPLSLRLRPLAVPRYGLGQAPFSRRRVVV
jgi:hypothetical protein